jgi:hypothetical protein
MKKWLIGFVSLFTSNLILAQSFEEIDWQGKKVPAYSIDVYQNSVVTEDAIKEQFIQMGFNPKILKGILNYRSIKISEIDSDPYDVLIRVDKKNKLAKDISVVYFSMAKNYDQYIHKYSDSAIINKMKGFAAKFQEWANAKALDIEIVQQESRIKTEDKKLKELIAEKDNIAEKIKKLEESQKINLKEIEKQKIEVESQKKALKLLSDKRKE